MFENFPWLLFLGISGGILLLFAAIAGTDIRVRRRVNELAKQDPRRARGHFAKSMASRGAFDALLSSPIIPKIREQLLPNDEQTQSAVQTRLLHAGIYSSQALFIYYVTKLTLMVLPLLVGGLGGVLGFWQLERGLFIGALAGCVALLIPGLWLDRLKAKRQRVLRKALPDCLDLLSTCMSAGMSMQMGLKRVGDELATVHPMLAAEINAVQHEVELGGTLDNALQRLANRTDLDDLRALALFVHQSQRYGTTMSEAMNELTDSLRYQREQRAEELAQKANVKILVPTLLFIFPAVFVVVAGPAVISLQQEFAAPDKNSQVASDPR